VSQSAARLHFSQTVHSLLGCAQYNSVDLLVPFNLDFYQDTAKKETRSPAEFSFSDLNSTKLAGTIEGRGNSTWNLPKKPYQLRLADDTNYKASTGLLGMPKNRHWVLLANYSDKSLLRNEVAFCLSKFLDVNWTPKSRPVNLFSNAPDYKYEGLYQLVEHVRVDSSRVNLGERTSDKFAFFLERDAHYKAEPFKFLSVNN